MPDAEASVYPRAAAAAVDSARQPGRPLSAGAGFCASLCPSEAAGFPVSPVVCGSKTPWPPPEVHPSTTSCRRSRQARQQRQQQGTPGNHTAKRELATIRRCRQQRHPDGGRRSRKPWSRAAARRFADLHVRVTVRERGRIRAGFVVDGNVAATTPNLHQRHHHQKQQRQQQQRGQRGQKQQLQQQ